VGSPSDCGVQDHDLRPFFCIFISERGEVFDGRETRKLAFLARIAEGRGWHLQRVGLFTSSQARTRVTFNIFTAKRVFCFGQHYRIDDLITGKLSGDKCSVLRQFLVSEFHFLAVFKCFDPLVAHLAPPSGDSVEIIHLFGASTCVLAVPT